jgi:hypothetical protein
MRILTKLLKANSVLLKGPDYHLSIGNALRCNYVAAKWNINFTCFIFIFSLRCMNNLIGVNLFHILLRFFFVQWWFVIYFCCIFFCSFSLIFAKVANYPPYESLFLLAFLSLINFDMNCLLGRVHSYLALWSRLNLLLGRQLCLLR